MYVSPADTLITLFIIVFCSNVVLFSVVPKPNWPLEFVPVTYTLLFPSLKIVCVFPVDACLIFLTSFSFVGTFLFSLSPVPNVEYVLPPQVYTYPSTVVAIFEISPASIVPILSFISTFWNSFILPISLSPIPNCP